MSDIPLTPEQRLFAAENHDLVSSMTNIYRKMIFMMS